MAGGGRARRRCAAGALAVALGAAACTGGAAPAEPPPPIVLVSIDTLTARHLSLYGYPRETSPNLDRFARDAFVFERCWANSAWTLPSYLSQLSGLYPWSHRVEQDGVQVPGTLAPERVTFAEALRERGYATAAFVDNPHLAASNGFAQGFDVYDDSAARIDKRDHAGGARKVFADGLAWLDGLAPDRPYLLMLQVLDVHGPYLPTAPWRDAFDGDGLGPAEPRAFAPVARAPDDQLVFGAVPAYVADAARPPGAPAETAALAPLADAYDAEILQLDAALGELFDALAERGEADRAVVIVSADHGESMVAHDVLFGHAMPYEPELHVPLVIRPPGGVPAAAKGGRRVADPVQLVDLHPTIVELAGAAPPDGLHGRSLVPALRGERLAPRPLIAQADVFDGQAAYLDGVKVVELRPSLASGAATLASYPPFRAWLEARFGQIGGAPVGTAALPVEALAQVDLETLWDEMAAEVGLERREVYDLDADPDERRDLAADPPADVDAVVAELVRALERARALSAAARAEAAAPAEGDAELRRALDDLGYGGR